MAEITAAMVRELRDRTGAGMMDCKKALTEASGDMEAAIDWLRKKGLSAAAKKSGRVAAEGLIGVASGPCRAAMVEVNAETDFVARNELFQAFVANVAELALSVGGDVEVLKAARYPGVPELIEGAHDRRTVQEELTHLIATIGENMSIRRAKVLSVSSGAVATYVHNAVKPGLGKIGVLVALEAANELEAMESLGRQIGMHVYHWGRVQRAGAGEGRAPRAGRRLRQARGDHREDDRGPHPQVLRGSGTAGAGLGA